MFFVKSLILNDQDELTSGRQLLRAIFVSYFKVTGLFYFLKRNFYVCMHIIINGKYTDRPGNIKNTYLMHSIGDP